MNPNTGGDLGVERRFEIAEQANYHDPEHPSHVVYPLLSDERDHRESRVQINSRHDGVPLCRVFSNVARYQARETLKSEKFPDHARIPCFANQLRASRIDSSSGRDLYPN